MASIEVRGIVCVVSNLLLFSDHRPDAHSPKSRSFSDETILFVSLKRKRLEARNIAVILIFIPFTTYKRSALQNKQVGVLRMAFRTRKVSGTFDKRASGLERDRVSHRSCLQD